jgi:hypothetical protein
MNKIIDTIINIAVVIILVLTAATRQQYSYYKFIRWAVFGTSVYFAYVAFRKQQNGMAVYFACVALLFNPFKPIWFQKETWHIVDYLVAAITGLSIFYQNGNRDH